MSENFINIDYTYCSPNQAFSVIDHFIISICLSSSFAVYKTISSMSNISDHVPLFLDVEWPSPKSLTYLTQLLIKYQIHYGFVPPRHKKNIISLDLIFIYQILVYHILHCYVRISLVLFILIYLIWICFIRILLMRAYLPQTMPYRVVSINNFLVGHRNRILPENSHCFGTLYGMHVGDHGRVRLRHTRYHYHYLIRRIKKNGDLAVRRSLGNALLRDPSDIIGLK